MAEAGGRRSVRSRDAGTRSGGRRAAHSGPVELANLVAPTLPEVIVQAHLGDEPVRCTPHPAYSFLRHAGLSVA